MIEFDEFADRLARGEMDHKLRGALKGKREVLELISELPTDNLYVLKATRSTEYILQKSRSILAAGIKEELSVYNPSTLSKSNLQANLGSFANALAECYELCGGLPMHKQLVELYLEVKVAALKERQVVDSSRDYFSSLHFAVLVWLRELYILIKIHQDLDDEPSFPLFAAELVYGLVLATKEWVELSEERAARCSEEVARKASQIRASIDHITEILDGSRALELLPETHKRELVSVIALPFASISMAVQKSIEAEYARLLAGDTEYHELEDKVSSLDFSKLFAAVESTASRTGVQGFSLSAVEWLKSTDGFVRGICQKLEDCCCVLESHFYEGIETGSIDPYLSSDLQRFFRYFSETATLKDCIHQQERSSADPSCFCIKPKLAVSMFEILVECYSGLLGFADNLGRFLSLMPERLESQSLLTKESRQLLQVDQLAEFQSQSKKLAHEWQSKFESLQSAFKTNLLNLVLKDARLLVLRYFQVLNESKTGTNQILIQLEQAFSQFLFKIDKICSDDSHETKQAYLSSKSRQWGALSAAVLKESEKFDGVAFWKEEFIAAVFGYFFGMARHFEDRHESAKLESDLQTLKRSFTKYLKYTAN